MNIIDKIKISNDRQLIRYEKLFFADLIEIYKKAFDVPLEKISFFLDIEMSKLFEKRLRQLFAIQIKFLKKDDTVSQYIDEYARDFLGQKIIGINETSLAKIKEVFQIFIIDSVSQSERLKIIAEHITGNTYRFKTIARTEAHSAMNYVSFRTSQYIQESTGELQYKTWLSAKDERVRRSHLSASGQTVPVNTPFIVGGEELMMPGLGKIPENNINCRCTCYNGSKDVLQEIGINII